MVSKFDNHDPSVFWMTVKDVDKLKIALDYMKESNTATEEYGKFLNPIVQRCSDGVLVYAGLVQYFDDTNGNKGPLSKYKLSLLFDSVAELKDCICNLETLVKELSGIHEICKKLTNLTAKLMTRSITMSGQSLRDGSRKILRKFLRFLIRSSISSISSIRSCLAVTLVSIRGM